MLRFAQLDRRRTTVTEIPEKKWTDERVELLKKLWKEGKSASEIAIALGNDITRNAVIGKVHRLQLSSHGKNVRLTRRQQEVKENPETRKVRAPNALQRFPRRTNLPALPEPKPLPLAEGQPITVLHLSETTCKWPIGDPNAEGFCFCGHSPRDSSPYCEYHARMAHQPAQRRMIPTVNMLT